MEEITEYDMLLKDEQWLINEINLLKKSIQIFESDLKEVREKMSNYQENE